MRCTVRKKCVYTETNVEHTYSPTTTTKKLTPVECHHHPLRGQSLFLVLFRSAAQSHFSKSLSVLFVCSILLIFSSVCLFEIYRVPQTWKPLLTSWNRMNYYLSTAVLGLFISLCHRSRATSFFCWGTAEQLSRVRVHLRFSGLLHQQKSTVCLTR